MKYGLVGEFRQLFGAISGDTHKQGGRKRCKKLGTLHGA
jgi:hypothetical protein